MDLSIKGKNAIVCASSQGLGKSAALDLAKEGVNLAICSRNKDKVDLVKTEIEEISDVKVVAISISSMVFPVKCFLTQPPTNRAATVSLDELSCSLRNTYFRSLFL